MDFINSTEVLWSVQTKNTDAEEFSTVLAFEGYSEGALIVECPTQEGTNITFNVYTNANGNASGQWETVKATAIQITTQAVCKTYTFPDPTTQKKPARYIRIGVTGLGLVDPDPGPEVKAIFSAWLVRRTPMMAR